jgi:hypothetical protein
VTGPSARPTLGGLNASPLKTIKNQARSTDSLFSHAIPVIENFDTPDSSISINGDKLLQGGMGATGRDMELEGGAIAVLMSVINESATRSP